MFLWVDLETTGLDPRGSEIIEVAWFITDNWEIISPPRSYVVTPTKDTFDLIKGDMFVRTMHEDSGLVNDIVLGDTLMLEDIEDLMLKDIHKYVTFHDMTPVLAGASVHFDRSFIHEYMWRLDRELSHRHFDVSAIRMFFNVCGFGYIGERDTPTVHRALPDIKATYKLAKQYRNLIDLMIDDEGETDAKRKSL